jgi:hypothetical protein
MTIKLQELLQTMAEEDEAIGDIIPPMPVPGNVVLDETDPSRLHEIVKLLRGNPILMEPALNWLTQKIAEISAATLSVLYTEDQLSEMRNRLGD